MKGFVVIAEPDKSNEERIRAILDIVEHEFDYVIVNTAEQAIELVESRQPDVFIGDMNMPYVNGAELFSMVQMLSPDTVSMVMTDAVLLKDVVAFMNECKTFKVIIKPCRVADDIVTPIVAGLAYKEMKTRQMREMEEADVGFFATETDYMRMRNTWQENLNDYERVQKVFAELLESNLRLGNHSPEIKAALKSRYDWMMKEYVKDILDSSGDYELCTEYLRSEWKRFDGGCEFQIRNVSGETIRPEQMKKITYILQLLRRVCGELLYHYDIRILIEAVKKAYILRFLCVLDDVPTEENMDKLFRVKEKEVRDALIRAAEKGVEAFHFHAVMLNRDKNVVINIAIPKTS